MRNHDKALSKTSNYIGNNKKKIVSMYKVRHYHFDIGKMGFP